MPDHELVNAEGRGPLGAAGYAFGLLPGDAAKKPDVAQPVKVDLAAVRWVQDDQFGVSFLEVSPDARACLEQVCQIAREAQQPKVKMISILPFLGSEEEVVSRGGPPMRKKPNS